MAKQRVVNTQSFNAPLQFVFNWFAKHENLDQVFQGNKHELVQPSSSNAPYGVGSVRRISVAAVPLPAFEETVTVFEAPNRYEYTITKGSPLKNHYGVMLFSENEGVTTLEYVIEFDGRIPGTGGLIAKSLRKQIPAGLLNAKAIIEAS